MRHVPLLIALLCTAGCASPETMDAAPMRVLAAVPGLTWVDGDPAAGTTTMVSLPLLTYRSTERHPGWFDSSTWVLPLLGRFAQTDRYVRLEWPAPAAAPGCPEDEFDLTPERRPRSGVSAAGPRAERGRGGVTLAEPGVQPPPRHSGVTSAGPGAEPGGGPLGEGRGEGRGSRGGSAALDHDLRAGPGGTVRSDGARGHLVLRLPRKGEVVRQRPAQRTEWDLLGSLIRHHSARPAEVVVELAPEPDAPPGSRSSRIAVYELGARRDELRLLPLFSYEGSERGTDWTIWPLLGLGYVREGERRALRLLHFIKIPLE
ncbi:MAG: hypothetical protein AB7N76_13335 [Planctomycetota bacterium]